MIRNISLQKKFRRAMEFFFGSFVNFRFIAQIFNNFKSVLFSLYNFNFFFPKVQYLPYQSFVFYVKLNSYYFYLIIFPYRFAKHLSNRRFRIVSWKCCFDRFKFKFYIVQHKYHKHNNSIVAIIEVNIAEHTGIQHKSNR